MTNIVVGTNAFFSGRIYSQTEIAIQMATVTPPSIGSGPVEITGVCKLQTSAPVKSSKRGVYKRRQMIL